MRITRRLKRTLLVISLAAMFVGLFTFAAIATPFRYRVGPWQRLPALDHRLLPHLSALFAAAFGAFFGSLSAFYLGRLQQQSDRREKRHAALIGAQYALMSQWNVVEEIRVGHIERFRNDPDRFAKLPLYYFNVSPTFVPFAELTFILETRDPNILQEIHLAEQSYQTCAEALKLRNEKLAKFYDDPRISHQILDFGTGAAITKADTKDMFLLRKATDGLYTCVDRTLPRLASAVEKLEELIKSMFPGKRALRMIPDSPVARANSGSFPT